jgi:hypothetical protein
MLVALLALFVALGGSSYAAVKLGRNSVGPRQLKPNSVSSPKVKSGSLLLSDFRASQRSRLRGPQGAQGPQGAPGPQGPAGTPDGFTRAEADARFLAAQGSTLLSVPPGTWIPDDADVDVSLSANVANFRGVGPAPATGFVTLNPVLPAVLAGRSLAVAAAVLCYDADSPTGTLDAVFLDVFRTPAAGGLPTSIAQVQDETNRDDVACRRYALPAPTTLGARDFVNFRFRMSWTALLGTVAVEGTWLELVPGS